MEAGDTFKYGRGGHLWVVVSDPAANPGRVVIVSMTTDRGIDPSCILEPGDHPFIRHRTSMRYDLARLVTDANLERNLASNTIRLQKPVSQGVLDRIRQGAAAAATTDRIPFGCKEVLIDQGLIEP
jgi:hypothetical protein